MAIISDCPEFFTRIPVPQNTPFTEQRLNQANRYFGLVGCIVGLLSALSYLVFAAILPVSIAIGFAMITSMLITGAFHEDGLADGFGGGWTVEKTVHYERLPGRYLWIMLTYYDAWLKMANPHLSCPRQCMATSLCPICDAWCKPRGGRFTHLLLPLCSSRSNQ